MLRPGSILALLAAGALAIGASPPASGNRLYVYGDSLSLDRDGQGWPSLAENMRGGVGGWTLVNRSINGNGLVWRTRCFGDPASERLQSDLPRLQAGEAVLVAVGVNDLIQPALPAGTSACFGPGELRAEQLIAGFEGLIDRYRGQPGQLLLATIAPFSASEYHRPALEAKRQTVNRWLRSNWPNGLVDFDRILAAPDSPERLDSRFDSGDGLHLSAAGNRQLAEAVATTMTGTKPPRPALLGASPAWIDIFGTANTDWVNRAIELADGDIVAAGFVNRDATSHGSDWDLLVRRYRPDGTLLWDRRLARPGLDAAWSVVAAEDGTVAVGGFSATGGAGASDAYLAKFTRDGEMLWERHYGTPGDDRATDLLAMADGGYLLIGQTDGTGAGGLDVLLVRTDRDGRELWRHTYGTATDDRGFYGAALPDGGAIIAGVTGPRGSYDLLLQRVDADGHFLWRRVIAGDGNDANHGVARLADGHIALVGYGPSWAGRGNDISVLLFSEAGDLLTHRLIGGEGDDRVQFIAADPAGGAWLAGYTQSLSGEWRALVARLGPGGGLEPWLGAIGGEGADTNGSTIALSRSGDLILGGYTQLASGAGGQPDGFLLKVRPSDVERHQDGIAVRTVELSCVTDGDSQATCRQPTDR